MTATITATRSGIAKFKSGVDELLEKRNYFKSRVEPMLIEGTDYYIIKGRKSLGKAGAEKLASIYGLTAAFKKDAETLESFRVVDGLVAYVCSLYHDGKIVGEGRGAAMLKNNGNDVNKTIKMSQKSAYLDSIIRTTGLSDIFTQDLENMPPENIQPTAVKTNIDDWDNPDIPYERVEAKEEIGAETEPVPITERQKEYLTDLAMQNLDDGKEKEEYLASIDSMTRTDASDSIKGLLALAGR